MDNHSEAADSKEGGAEDFKIKIDPDWDSDEHENSDCAVNNPKGVLEETVYSGGGTFHVQQRLCLHTHGKDKCNAVC